MGFYESWKFPISVFAAIGALHTVPNLVGYHPIHDADIENIQQDNNDLRQQITDYGHKVGSLMLNEGDKRFSFYTTVDGQPKLCEGSYEEYDKGFFAWNDHKVKITGSLTCSQTVELG